MHIKSLPERPYMPGELHNAVRIGTITVDDKQGPLPLIRNYLGKYWVMRGPMGIQEVPEHDLRANWPRPLQPGRPLVSTERMLNRAVTLANSDMDMARTMGAGNVSAGIRKALATCAAMGLVA